ncbi:serotriflin-like [Rhea pennata]|uniref:serotriflin-like n=1 Tax=Rhea pennata TaxID=8795 RepID=UPI002E26DA6B
MSTTRNSGENGQQWNNTELHFGQEPQRVITQNGVQCADITGKAMVKEGTGGEERGDIQMLPMEFLLRKTGAWKEARQVVYAQSKGREMGPLTAVIFLATLLHQSCGQPREKEFAFFARSEAQNEQQIVDQHNEIRRSVIPTASNMLKMVWNEKAAINAKKWANKCQMKMSPREERVVKGVVCGENILQSSYPSTWPEAIKVWANQMSNFKYGVGSIKKNANIHSYTQLIWYNSYQVGCAVAYCPNSRLNYFYVCHYCPAGNDLRKIATPYNKGPKCGDCPGHCDRGLCTNPCKHQDLIQNCENMEKLFGCQNDMVRIKCPATCKCTTQIK